MILYNLTVKVDEAVAEEWLDWMKTKHIPDMMETGMFESHKMFRIIQDESDGITYAIQYFCKDMKTMQQYASQFAPALQAEHKERYKDKYVAIRTLMEDVLG